MYPPDMEEDDADRKFTPTPTRRQRNTATQRQEYPKSGNTGDKWPWHVYIVIACIGIVCLFQVLYIT